MTITHGFLLRAASVAAAAAGLIFIGVQIGHPYLDASSITTTDVIIRNSLKMLMVALALAGITGVYLFQVTKIGVLGLIVEAVSGQDYYAYVREHIFRPAGMGDTDSYLADEIVPNRAVSYTKEGSRWRSAVFQHPARGSSAGGGYSTARDLVKFASALKSGKLVPPAPRSSCSARMTEHPAARRRSSRFRRPKM